MIPCVLRCGVESDVRNYKEAAWILPELMDQRPIRFLTNNPTKLAGLQTERFVVLARFSIEAEPNDYTCTIYLLIK